MKSNSRKRNVIMIIVNTLLFVAATIFGVLFFGNIFDISVHQAVGVPFIVASFAFFAVLLFLIRGAIVARSERLRLESENLYTFGKESDFYNLYHFERKSILLRKGFLNKKKNHTLVVFSFAPIAVSSNPDHNDKISLFNRLIAEYMEKFFHTQSRRNGQYGNTVYGFSRGSFLLYLFCKEEGVVPLVEKLSNDIYRLGQENNVSVLIHPFFGISHTDPSEAFPIALENASLARSHAEMGFESYAHYDPSFKTSSTLSEIEELEKAIENKELVVYYQPKYSLKEKKIVSAEALVRWDSPKYGLLAPASFIEKAESAGLIYRIDSYVFEMTLRDMADALSKGHRVVPVSVNFSLYEFFSPNFLDFVTGLLDRYKIPPTLIEVEITETTSQTNQFMSIQIIKRLKDKGVRVLMDDFGIGYSGIDNLRKIPFDGIKVDKSFTDSLIEDEKTRAIIKLIVELGHMNDIEVIIEGVDSQDQVDILKKMKMDTIQGFYYSRPIPFDQYEAFLKDNPYERKGGKMS